MVSVGLQFPDAIIRLAKASEQAFAGHSRLDKIIDRDYADFAIRRHKLGPLLAVAVRNGADCEPDAKDRLDQHWKKNALNIAINEIFAQRVANSFSQKKIPALHFKGVPLARRLYPDPQWRHCGDMDLLVPPDHFELAQKTLLADGLRCSKTLDRLPNVLRATAAKAIRDLPFDDPRSTFHLELHSRLNFSFHISNRANYPGFATAISSKNERLATPLVDAGLAHYLLLHGAVSKWVRFKWLADIAPLMQYLDVLERSRLADWAERTGTSAAIKAGLTLVQAAFPNLNIAPLDAWLAEVSGTRAVRERVRVYAAALCDPGLSRSPAVSRRAALQSAWLQNDSFLQSAKLVPHAVGSSALRFLARRRKNRD